MTAVTANKKSTSWRQALIVDSLLVVVLLVGAYFRLVGLDWGDYTYLHPDERFLIWVGTDISPVQEVQDPQTGQVKTEWISPSQYFDTATSPLNPANRGHTYYVYGTLPMFITRVAVQLVYNHSGFNEMTNVGRALSAVFDLLTVLLVFLTAERLYNRRVGLLAAAFTSLAVLQIQQSHFFTMDTFYTFFTLLALYFGVRILTDHRDWGWERLSLRELFANPLLLSSLGFGLALGFTAASKINAVPVAMALPGAVLIRLMYMPERERSPHFWQAMPYMIFAAAVSLVTFRVFQPYAFSGPGFFGIKPNPQWIATMKELAAGASGQIDYPFALQWARRNDLFAWKNMVLWGMGLPLGLLSWAGFLWMGWRILRGAWQHALLWMWTLYYFVWQSTVFNPSMRYQLLIYPTLFIFAAWLVVYLYDRGRDSGERAEKVTTTGHRPPTGDGLPFSPDRGTNFPDHQSGEEGVVGLAGGIPPLQFAVPDGALDISSSDISESITRQQVEDYPSQETAVRGLSSVVVNREHRWLRPLALVLATVVLLLTLGWAWAFTRIYTRPVTRVAATHWIYQNIPGPINLHIQTSGGMYNQPLNLWSANYNSGYQILPGEPYVGSFVSQADGILTDMQFGSLTESGTGSVTLHLEITQQPGGKPVAVGNMTAPLTPNQTYNLPLDQPLAMVFNQRYYFTLSSDNNAPPVLVDGPVSAQIQTSSGLVSQALPYPTRLIRANEPYSMNFTPKQAGPLKEIVLGQVAAEVGTGQQTLQVNVLSGAGQPLAQGTLQADLTPQGQDYTVPIQPALNLDPAQAYILQVNLLSSGTVSIRGTGITNESDFDDVVPLRLDGYDGIYPRGLSMQIYWAETPASVDRYLNMMQQSQYLVITSSRQWASVTRIPERYPMATLYYQKLMGCPQGMSVESCYNTAQVGSYQGQLGYRLVQVFESDPNIGPLKINDQPAEEVFTVYDHPKVFIFQKTAAFDPQQVRNTLSSVDFSQVLNWLPIQFTWHPANLMLPAQRLQDLLSNGTWSKMFNVADLQNRFEGLGVILWYVTVGLLGLAFYPILRLALPGLYDKGYPLARLGGILGLGWLVWIGGSLQIFVTQLSITAAALLILIVGGILAYWQRDELRREWRQKKYYFLAIEALALALFLFDLYVRYNNPDLWHPYKGGEKPMDFSFLNAVIKSVTFPPYDPWFAGGYMNYYYYGFVLFGVLIKWLGIVPAFGYNLILPTVFMLIGLGAFSGAWNIYTWRQAEKDKQRLENRGRASPDGDEPGIEGLPNTGGELLTAYTETEESDEELPDQPSAFPVHPFLVGLAGTLGMVVLGNLGTVRMIYQGYERLAAPGGVIDNATIFTRIIWIIQGAAMALGGKPLPYGISDWYWIPSRVMPPNDLAITEFPYFTVLYGDPHAHLYAMAIAMLALAWAISTFLGRARWRGPVGVIASFFVGGLAIGALYPTNLSDIYTYLPLGLVALGYSLWRYANVNQFKFLSNASPLVRRGLVTLAGLTVLTFLAIFLYRPYDWWYGQAYNSVQIWKGVRTPLYSYFTHWGLFLFVIVTWMIWETRDWMAKTPLSSLRKLEPYKSLILAGLALLFLVMAAAQYWITHQSQPQWNWYGISIIWLVLPLAIWAGLLILRPGQPDSKRLVLFMIGTGLLITLMVDFVEVRGDINRMNTVFKFYLQAWTLFAVASAAAVGWLISSFREWHPNWKLAWQVPFVVLVVSAGLFTLLGTTAKMKDRMAADAPHTLDGMLFMKYSTYPEGNVQMDLSQDYNAIRWMQDNVQGSPVIVGAKSDALYQWFSRFSIYTGLPGPVGWQWHEQQQRAQLPADWVSNRVVEVNAFYLTTDLNQARSFLEKYHVQYIVVGQLERLHYPGPGINKFAAQNGKMWKAVYQDRDTVIYQVIQ